MTLLLLALVGVSAEIIAADYEVSTKPPRALYAAMGATGTPHPEVPVFGL